MLLRTFCANPEIDVVDEYRILDNGETARCKVLDYNETESRLANPVLLTFGDHHCNHLQDGTTKYTSANGPFEEGVEPPEPEACSCSKRYDHYMAIESVYYKGVLEDIYENLRRDYDANKPSRGHVVFNNYLAALKMKIAADTIVKERYFMSRIHKQELDLVTLEALPNYENVIESKHTIRFEKEDGELKLRVIADVQGNELPYYHGIPDIPDEQYIHDVRGEYVYMWKRNERVWNGEIPLDSYTIKITKKSKMSEFQIKSRLNWSIGNEADFNSIALFMSKDDMELYSFLVDKSYEKNSSTMCESDERTSDEILELNVPEVNIKEVKEEQMGLIFNEALIPKKKSQEGEKHIDAKEHRTRMASNKKFVNWLRNQFVDKRGKAELSLKMVDGEAFLVLRRFKSYFFGIFNEIDSGKTAMAKLDDVIHAYVQIGIKQNTNSLRQACANHQKHLTEVTTDVFVAPDSFLIARYLRVSEEARWEGILGNLNL
jgi:hypothetical protein